MDGIGTVGFFGVRDTSAGRCELDVTARYDFGVAHRVFTVRLSACTIGKWNWYALFDLPINQICEDLEFSMRMCAESCVSCYSIFVYDTKRTEFIVFGIVVSATGSD